MSRTTNVPQYWTRKFPETRRQTLEQFLKKHGPLLWKGFDKTPEAEKAIIISKTNRGLRRKAETLKRITGRYTGKTTGKIYDEVSNEYIIIPTWRGMRFYRIDTRRFAKTPDWFTRIQ